jgi:hypothetical protein
MPWLELESSATFLAIKSCQRTKFGKVIKLARSSLKKWAHICAHRGKAVNQTKDGVATNKSTSMFAGHFNGHKGAPV